MGVRRHGDAAASSAASARAVSLFSKQMELALSGELQAYLDAADELVLTTAKAAVSTIAEEGRDRLRAMVRRAGLAREGAQAGKGTGRSLANAVRYDVYPRGARLARNPAALLYVQPSAVRIFEAFEKGATITAERSRFLTVPIPGSPASRAEFGAKPRGQSVLEKLKARGIEVAFVKATASRPAMLVANGVRLTATGRLSRIKKRKEGMPEQAFNPRSKKGFSYAKGEASIPLFFLVPRVNIPKRLDMAREFERLSAEFVDLFAREFAAAVGRLQTQRRRA